METLEKGYSESMVRIRRIPVAIQVSPVRIRIEPSDSDSTIIKCHHNYNVYSKLTQGSSLLLTNVIVFYGFKSAMIMRVAF